VLPTGAVGVLDDIAEGGVDFGVDGTV